MIPSSMVYDTFDVGVLEEMERACALLDAERRLASLALRSAALREAVLDGAGGTLRSARGAGPQQVLKLLQKLGEE